MNEENNFPLMEGHKRDWGILEKREMVSYKGSQAKIQKHKLGIRILLQLEFPWISFIGQEIKISQCEPNDP